MWPNLILTSLLFVAEFACLVQVATSAAPQSQAARAPAESQSTSRPAGGLPAAAARVVLRDGRVMRGDGEPAGDELILWNLAGEVRLARADIAGVTWLDEGDALAREFTSRLWAADPADSAARLALAQWAVENRKPAWAVELAEAVLAADPEHESAKSLLTRVAPLVEAESQPTASRDTRENSALPPPPLLTDVAINRLKLYEYPRDGNPEPIVVRFKKARGEPDVEELARREAARLSPPRPELLEAIEKGEPPARLQAILNVGGMAWADRMEVVGDPRVFKEFRTRVLPNITRGCARSGCHGGTTNYAFRFPIAPQSGDAFAYTTFAMLDGMRTQRGRMIDRDLPEASELPRLMLAGADGRSTHPPVKLGRVNPLFQSTKDPGYRDLLAWISALRVPHPDYELSYRAAEPVQRAATSRPVQRSESAPVTRPASKPVDIADDRRR